MLVLPRATQRYLPLHHQDVIITAFRRDDFMFILGERLKSKAMTWIHKMTFCSHFILISTYFQFQ